MTDQHTMRISSLTFFLLCSVFTWARPGERCLSDQDCPSLGGREGVPASSHPTPPPINYPSPPSPLPSHTDQEAVTKPAEEANYKPPPAAEISQELSVGYNGKPNQFSSDYDYKDRPPASTPFQTYSATSSISQLNYGSGEQEKENPKLKYGACSSDADCPSETPKCAEWGFCQRKCSSNLDCPADHPVCSKWGFCQCPSYQQGGAASCWDLSAPAAPAPSYTSPVSTSASTSSTTSTTVEAPPPINTTTSPSPLPSTTTTSATSPPTSVTPRGSPSSTPTNEEASPASTETEAPSAPTQAINNLLSESYQEPASDVNEKGKYEYQNGKEPQGQIVGTCSSNADCPPANPVCSEWKHCQCTDYQPGGAACWDLTAPGQEVARCSSNADCSSESPICSEWGYCQCKNYKPGGTGCWDLEAPPAQSFTRPSPPSTSSQEAAPAEQIYEDQWLLMTSNIGDQLKKRGKADKTDVFLQTPLEDSHQEPRTTDIAAPLTAGENGPAKRNTAPAQPLASYRGPVQTPL